jgi:hypothetical protein
MDTSLQLSYAPLLLEVSRLDDNAGDAAKAYASIRLLFMPTTNKSSPAAEFFLFQDGGYGTAADRGWAVHCSVEHVERLAAVYPLQEC